MDADLMKIAELEAKARNLTAWIEYYKQRAQAPDPRHNLPPQSPTPTPSPQSGMINKTVAASEVYREIMGARKQYLYALFAFLLVNGAYMAGPWYGATASIAAILYYGYYMVTANKRAVILRDGYGLR